MTTRIIFNGQEYQSLDAMPPEVRQAYDQLIKQLADADHDGIPDILQHGADAKLLGNIQLSHTRITVNGKTYETPDEMPPAVRALYDKAMAQAGAGSGNSTGTVQTRLVATTGDRTWTIKVSGRQLLTLGLLILIGIALVVLFRSGWHR